MGSAECLTDHPSREPVQQNRKAGNRDSGLHHENLDFIHVRLGRQLVADRNDLGGSPGLGLRSTRLNQGWGYLPFCARLYLTYIQIV